MWDGFLASIPTLIGPVFVSIIGYLTVRYISNRDKFEEDIEEKFITHTGAFDKKLSHHIILMNNHSSHVQVVVDSIKDESAEIRKMNLDFQMRIQEDIHDMRQVTADMGIDLRRNADKLESTFAEIGEINNRMNIYETAMKKIKATVNKHAKILQSKAKLKK